MKNIKYNVLYTIIGVLLTTVVFLLVKPSNKKIQDTRDYDRRIEQLEFEIRIRESKIDALSESINDRESKITEYKKELGQLQNKYSKEKRKYEKDIKRIKSMSISDIIREFTDTFK